MPDVRPNNGTTPVKTPGVMLINAREAARLLSISGRTLWTLTNTGELPCVRIGRAVRYDVADLQAWIASCKQSPKST